MMMFLKKIVINKKLKIILIYNYIERILLFQYLENFYENKWVIMIIGCKRYCFYKNV